MKVKVSLCFNRKIEVWRRQRVKSDLPVKLCDLTLPSFHSWVILISVVSGQFQLQHKGHIKTKKVVCTMK